MHTFIKIFGATLSLLLTAGPAAAESFNPIPAVAQERTLIVDGRERSYRLYVPSSIEALAPALVIGLHGGNSQGVDFEKLTGLSVHADRAGFVVAYPNAIGRYRGKLYWNDGRVPTVDDVGFIARLIDELVATLNIDRTRVYVTGFSNGASMTNRLGIELGDKIAAIAPVAGTLGVNQAQRSVPVRAMPVMYFHGTADPFAYYTGGSAGTWRGSALSAPAYAAWWARHNGCGMSAVVTPMPDNVDDGTRATRVAYESCRADADVVFYSIDNAGHTWPGGSAWAPEAITGKISRDLDASALMWQFFQAHRLALPSATP